MIWYPTDPHAEDVPTAPYLPPSWWLHAAAWGVAGEARRHAFVRAGGRGAGYRPLPVLLFSPAGWAPYFYAGMLEELASHGYVVVALAHTHEMIPMTVFADGRRRWFRNAAVAGALTVSKRPHAEDVRERGAVVDHKADDLRFALDQLDRLDAAPDPLGGRIDLGRVGAFGHSFGGGGGGRRLSDATPGSRRARTSTAGCGGSPTAPPSIDRASRVRRAPRDDAAVRGVGRAEDVLVGRVVRAGPRPPPRVLAAARRIGRPGTCVQIVARSTARSWTGGCCRSDAGRSAAWGTPRSTADGCGRRRPGACSRCSTNTCGTATRRSRDRRRDARDRGRSAESCSPPTIDRLRRHAPASSLGQRAAGGAVGVANQQLWPSDRGRRIALAIFLVGRLRQDGRARRAARSSCRVDVDHMDHVPPPSLRAMPGRRPLSAVVMCSQMRSSPARTSPCTT